MQRIALFAALALASGIAFAQNVAVVNNKPIPKARAQWSKRLGPIFWAIFTAPTLEDCARIPDTATPR